MDNKIEFIVWMIVGSMVGQLIANYISSKFRKKTKGTVFEEFHNAKTNPPNNGRHVVTSDGESFQIGYFSRNDNQGRGGWKRQGGEDFVIYPLYWTDIAKFNIK